ncbi:ABC transporter permease [Amaricoccus solimangrovi]|uniref:ABC transporter permease n=1 Tax=Amaricoccus solimangrovi TaxID=2589815 RepID=A0A501WS62_9RHOB|nr:ABC transporter permease [Amaricoccus solimangrovi]
MARPPVRSGGRRGGGPWVALASIALLIAVWSVAALVQRDPRILPGPWIVGPLTWHELVAGPLLTDIGATLRRVALSFLIAMGLGAGLGIAMGRSSRLDRWLDPWLIFFLNLPALVLIVLAYLWIGLNETAAVLAVAANKIPTVVVTMREGARALDPKLADMARVFRMTPLARLRHVEAPQLAPYVAAAGRSGIALIWKIVLVVEFLGRSNGVGFRIHMYFQLFDVARVLAYALSFVAVMLLIEAAVFRPWERRATRWRAG